MDICLSSVIPRTSAYVMVRSAGFLSFIMQALQCSESIGLDHKPRKSSHYLTASIPVDHFFTGTSRIARGKGGSFVCHKDQKAIFHYLLVCQQLVAIRNLDDARTQDLHS